MKRLVGIHLFENLNKHVSLGDGIYETGDWANISDERAEELVGGRIYLHRSQTAQCHIGGRILSYRSIPNTEHPTRPDYRIFKFRHVAATFGVVVVGWAGNEQFRDYAEI